MTLSAGSRLEPHEIVAQIGAGGMGEVYRAKDPRLSREVAIEVLPASFSEDAERLRRFEQEAKAAGVLNHPNVTAVYDIGTITGGARPRHRLPRGRRDATTRRADGSGPDHPGRVHRRREELCVRCAEDGVAFVSGGKGE